jgi:cystathionine gamma-synthase
LAAALARAPADLVWIETPANPAGRSSMWRAAADLAHAAGAILAVDGTCAPPCTTRALDLGADLVMHSATKYLERPFRRAGWRGHHPVRRRCALGHAFAPAHA